MGQISFLDIQYCSTVLRQRCGRLRIWVHSVFPCCAWLTATEDVKRPLLHVFLGYCSLSVPAECFLKACWGFLCSCFSTPQMKKYDRSLLPCPHVPYTILMFQVSIWHMVVSLNRGTPIWTPKYCNPYHGDPQKCALILGNPYMINISEAPGPFL